jgi:hypothetical protein
MVSLSAIYYHTFQRSIGVRQRNVTRAESFFQLADALVISSYGRLLLILLVIWDPDKLELANVQYIWLINTYVMASNVEAIRGALKSSAFLNVMRLT